MVAELIPTEYQECCLLVDWCRANNIRIVKNVNEGLRSYQEGKRLKRIGLSAGFPDYVLPYMRQSKGALYIEMKRKKSGKPSEQQLYWRNVLTEEGYFAVITYGADEAIEYVKNYLGIK